MTFVAVAWRIVAKGTNDNNSTRVPEDCCDRWVTSIDVIILLGLYTGAAVLALLSASYF